MIQYVSIVLLLLSSAIPLGHFQALAQQENAIRSSLSSILDVPSKCQMRDEGLPDPICTPGAADPAVNQNNIQNTICVPGYAKTVRPPPSFTDPLKEELMRSYGFGNNSPRNYELDHLIPLEVGGNPTNVSNLWPEPGYGQYNFHVKDSFERFLHDQVCSGSVSLVEAQHEIATNWISNMFKYQTEEPFMYR